MPSWCDFLVRTGTWIHETWRWEPLEDVVNRHRDGFIQNAVDDGRMDAAPEPKKQRTGDANPPEAGSAASVAGPGASGAFNPLPTDTVVSSHPSDAGAQHPQLGTNSTAEHHEETMNQFHLAMQKSRRGDDPPAAAPVAAGPWHCAALAAAALPAAAAGASLARVFEGATLHEVAPFLSAADKQLLVATSPGLMRDRGADEWVIGLLACHRVTWSPDNTCTFQVTFTPVDPPNSKAFELDHWYSSEEIAYVMNLMDRIKLDTETREIGWVGAVS